MADADVIWKGTPSQLINFKWFAIAFILAALAVPLWLMLGSEMGVSVKLGIVAGYLLLPLFVLLIPYINVSFTNYEITNERLRLSTGVLHRVTDELELYRIRDLTVVEPLHLRLFGLGTVVMHTSDRTHPEMRLTAVANPKEITENLRNAVEELREKKQVREVDFDGPAS